MSVISVTFIIFYFVVLVLYWNVPEKYRNLILLLASYAFVLSWKWYYLLFLIGVTVVSWIAGRIIIKYPKDRFITGVSTGIILAVLVIVKYTGLSLAVVGISFFSFQAISYIVDVYRCDVDEEKNLVVFALYIAFFPQLLAGPIAKSKNQIQVVKSGKLFNYEAIRYGMLQMLYGLFLKLVIADRACIFVDNVYGNVEAADRISIVMAVILYTVQIYCDFAGYSLIAIGMAESFGIGLPDNFKQPYLAKNINDFWKRWHISLTSWFRDYLYFPLGGNKKGTFRTYVNILIVFLLSGIWHGAGVTFVIWGLLHGLSQIIERLLKKQNGNHGVLTFIVVTLLWIPFRADSLSQMLEIISGIFSNNNTSRVESIFNHGLNSQNIILLMLMIAIMIIVDIIENRGENVINRVNEMKLVPRWIILLSVIMVVLVFGKYGPGYDAANFIYSKF